MYHSIVCQAVAVGAEVGKYATGSIRGTRRHNAKRANRNEDLLYPYRPIITQKEARRVFSTEGVHHGLGKLAIPNFRGLLPK